METLSKIRKRRKTRIFVGFRLLFCLLKLQFSFYREGRLRMCDMPEKIEIVKYLYTHGSVKLELISTAILARQHALVKIFRYTITCRVKHDVKTARPDTWAFSQRKTVLLCYWCMYSVTPTFNFLKYFKGTMSKAKIQRHKGESSYSSAKIKKHKLYTVRFV